MRIQSLGYRTDLIFAAFDGEILDHGDHLTIHTPSNPGFYWGNFLLFDHPPREGDYSDWKRLFTEEIGAPPRVTHQAFGWDTTLRETGAIKPFLEDGYTLGTASVLTTRKLQQPVRTLPDVSIRPLNPETDWPECVDLQVVCREPEFAEPEYRLFRQRQMERYRAMIAAGMGAWFGAFLDGQLVADLGIFHDKEVGRYQSVETHPDFRRKGIAGWLVYSAGQHALAEYGLHTLVIVSDADSPAQRVYQSVGFQLTEYEMSMEKPGPEGQLKSEVE